jgi:hypothetical protein
MHRKDIEEVENLLTEWEADLEQTRQEHSQQVCLVMVQYYRYSLEQCSEAHLFCADPEPAVLWSRPIFVRLWLQLVKIPAHGSSSDHFPNIIKKNSTIFMVSKKILRFFKDINDHQKVL